MVVTQESDLEHIFACFHTLLSLSRPKRTRSLYEVRHLWTQFRSLRTRR